eukprot:223981-Prymnesium_polylepis.1
MVALCGDGVVKFCFPPSGFNFRPAVGPSADPLDGAVTPPRRCSNSLQPNHLRRTQSVAVAPHTDKWAC